MNKFVPLVKTQIAWMKGQISRYPAEHPKYRPATIAMYERKIHEHEELLSFLEGLPDASTEVPDQNMNQLVEQQPVNFQEAPQKSLPVDLANLPPEILKELSGNLVNGNSDPLVDIINDRGGVATLDEILIDAYRKLGEVNKRNLLANRLYRLSKRGLLWLSPGRKGIYSTHPPIAGASAQSDAVINLFNREHFASS